MLCKVGSFVHAASTPYYDRPVALLQWDVVGRCIYLVVCLLNHLLNRIKPRCG